MPRTPTQPPIAYRDRQSRVWYVSGRSSVHRYRLPQDLTTTPVSPPPRPNSRAIGHACRHDRSRRAGGLRRADVPPVGPRVAVGPPPSDRATTSRVRRL